MSFGEVKVQYNNEIIRIKNFIVQAKIQTINNLSRKVKALKSKKGTPEQVEKNNRKAESFVSEIMIIKHIDRNELANFAMCSLDSLNKFIDCPKESKERAMARLLTHKTLNPLFQSIRSKFSSIPLVKLLERDPKKLQLKKRKDKLKKLKKEKENKKTTKVSAAEDDKKQDLSIDRSSLKEKCNEKVKKNIKSTKDKRNLISTDEFKVETVEETVDKSNLNINSTLIESNDDNSTDSGSENEPKISKQSKSTNLKDQNNPTDPEDESSNDNFFVKSNIHSVPKNSNIKSNSDNEMNIESKKEPPEKKDHPRQNKNKKQILIDMDNIPDDLKTETTVDSFFVTNQGDKYKTLALPRPADKVPEDQSRFSNRKMRRAAQYGHEISYNKPRNNSNKIFNSKKTEESMFFNTNDRNSNKLEERSEPRGAKRNMNVDNERRNKKVETEEKLHPSWEAKKRKPTILPFKGNKIKFDE